jgi:hypothetical protein
MQIVPGCLRVPNAWCPCPTKADVRYARWDASQTALERAEHPSTIAGLFCFNVPDVIPL